MHSPKLEKETGYLIISNYFSVKSHDNIQGKVVLDAITPSFEGFCWLIAGASTIFQSSLVAWSYKGLGMLSENWVVLSAKLL